ncbi:MAG TPA: NAD-dependent epimerase/dehydratase family protein [Methanoregula sp.]|nr:NAD-dependent epimerase/dehydratase family protein [Methanoregula sp.]
MKVLVTGAAGFTGMQMMEYLTLQEGVNPVGLIHRQTPGMKSGRGCFEIADLLLRDDLERVIRHIAPEAVIHLAGLTHGSADALFAANVTGTRNLIDAVVAVNPDCRILVISSSAVYGYAGELPISETTPPNPVSEYGTSKAEQEKISSDFIRNGAAIAIVRPFNLTGPGQTNSFVCGRIVNQIVEIERGEREFLDLWETASSRDLIDVRDAVRGYWALVSHADFSSDCSGKVFNLGSGRAYQISVIIDLIESMTGKHYLLHLPEAPPVITIPTQQSDNSRITALTGWKPVIPLRDTLRDMLDAARKRSN